MSRHRDTQTDSFRPVIPLTQPAKLFANIDNNNRSPQLSQYSSRFLYNELDKLVYEFSLQKHALLTVVNALVVIKVYSDVQYWPLFPVMFWTGCSRSSTPPRRFVFSAGRTSEHISPLLRDLYYPRVPRRIQFRLCDTGELLTFSFCLPLLPSSNNPCPLSKNVTEHH